METLAERDGVGAWGGVVMIHALNLIADYVAAGALLAIAIKLGLQLVQDLEKRSRVAKGFAGITGRLRGSQGQRGPIGDLARAAKPGSAMLRASSAYSAHIGGNHPLGCACERGQQ